MPFLASLLSSYLLQKELEELEDGGMAELLAINEKLSVIISTDVNVNEINPVQRQPGVRGNLLQRQTGEINNTTDSLPAVQRNSTVPQSTICTSISRRCSS